MKTHCDCDEKHHKNNTYLGTEHDSPLCDRCKLPVMEYNGHYMNIPIMLNKMDLQKLEDVLLTEASRLRNDSPESTFLNNLADSYEQLSSKISEQWRM